MARGELPIDFQIYKYSISKDSPKRTRVPVYVENSWTTSTISDFARTFDHREVDGKKERQFVHGFLNFAYFNSPNISLVEFPNRKFITWLLETKQTYEDECALHELLVPKVTLENLQFGAKREAAIKRLNAHSQFHHNKSILAEAEWFGVLQARIAGFRTTQRLIPAEDNGSYRG